MKLSGSKIRAAREDKGLSRAEVARLARTSVDTIKRAEAGTNDPASATLARVAVVLEVPMDSLFTNDQVSA